MFATEKFQKGPTDDTQPTALINIVLFLKSTSEKRFLIPSKRLLKNH